MASLIIPNVDDDLRARLEARAADRGRSVEEEAREILADALDKPEHDALPTYERIRALVEPLGGIQWDLPEREAVGAPPQFNSAERDR